MWKLEEGKEYIIGNRCIYKIERGDLLAKFVGDDEWKISEFTYPEIMNLDFIECIPPTDWSKVKVDTKVFVRSYDDFEWIPRYFAKFEDNRIYVWNNGRTSFTRRCEEDYIPYKEAKLYKSFKSTKSIVEEMREYIGAGGETMDEKLRQWISQLNEVFL